MNKRTVTWRYIREPFRGETWEFRNYKILHEGTAFRLTHGGVTRLIASDWFSCDDSTKDHWLRQRRTA
jgi:hypothetical protein